MARYKIAKKYCRKVQPPEYGARTLQTTDRHTENRRICDSKHPNVTYSHIRISVNIQSKIQAKFDSDDRKSKYYLLRRCLEEMSLCACCYYAYFDENAS